MYIESQPAGSNLPVDEDRQPIWRAVNGDELWMTTRLALPDGDPVTPVNSILSFALAEHRFSDTPFWTGSWHAGLEEVDGANHPGLVRVRVPDSVANTLRRGAYRFSITVSNRLGRDKYTAVTGTLLVEYEPTSVTHEIPYKD